MIKKTYTYTDYNGIEKTEDFYFNLDQAELIELAFGPYGGLDNLIKEIISSGDTGKSIEVLKKIILTAYGKKTPDGRFTKKSEHGHPLSDTFRESVVYPKLFMELGFNDKAAIEFIKGCLPPEYSEKMPVTADRIINFEQSSGTMQNVTD